MKHIIPTVLMMLLLIAAPAAAQNDCGNGLPCGIAPWRLPSFPELESPTPFPTVLATAVPPTATPSPTVLATNTPTSTATPIYCATQGGVVTAVPYTTRVLSYSPAAYWPLNESAGTIAIDATGNGRHATYSGVTLGGGTFLNGDRSPSFDGVNDFINLYTAINGTFSGSSGTFAGWAKAVSSIWSDTAANRLLNVQATSILRIDSGSATNNTLTFLTHGKSYGQSTSTTSWFHWAVTWNTATDTVAFYFNGTNISSQNGLSAWSGVLNSAATVLGAANTSGVTPWNGNISHVALWTSALNLTQIADLANLNAPAPTPTQIPGCSPFVPTATATSQFDVSGVNNQIQTMQAILNATPVPAPTASGVDPGAYAGQAFGFLIGLQSIHFGVFTPLIQLAFFSLFTFIGLRVAFFLLPIIAAFIGIIRKLVQVILDFIPG